MASPVCITFSTRSSLLPSRQRFVGQSSRTAPDLEVRPWRDVEVRIYLLAEAAMMFRRRRLLIVGIVLVAAAAGLAAILGPTQRRTEREAARIAEAMSLKPGWAVADVGAGDGRFTVELARRVGPQGRLLATEIDAKSLAEIRAGAARAGLRNVTALEGGERETKLPDACCDAILLRDVYHHITQPAAINASLFRALRPGGTLVVIDFEPGELLTLVVGKVKGVPADRGGHGMPRALLIREVTTAGFHTAREIPDWSWPGGYCVVFQRPA